MARPVLRQLMPSPVKSPFPQGQAGAGFAGVDLGQKKPFVPALYSGANGAPQGATGFVPPPLYASSPGAVTTAPRNVPSGIFANAPGAVTSAPRNVPSGTFASAPSALPNVPGGPAPIFNANIPGLSLSGQWETDVIRMLSALYQRAHPRSARYTPRPFNFATWIRQQVFAENPNRSYLIIQVIGNGDLFVVFEESAIQATSFAAATAQPSLTLLQGRAIQIVGGGSYEPIVAPTNAITIFTLNAATNGIVIEGE